MNRRSAELYKWFDSAKKQNKQSGFFTDKYPYSGVGLELIIVIRHDWQYLIVQNICSYKLVSIYPKWVVGVFRDRIKYDFIPWGGNDCCHHIIHHIVFFKIHNLRTSTDCWERRKMQQSQLKRQGISFISACPVQRSECLLLKNMKNFKVLYFQRYRLRM